MDGDTGGLIEPPSEAPRLVSFLRMSLEFTLIDRPRAPVLLLIFSVVVSAVLGGLRSVPCPVCTVSGPCRVALGSRSRVLRTLKLFFGVSVGLKTASDGGGWLGLSLRVTRSAGSFDLRVLSLRMKFAAPLSFLTGAGGR